VTVILIKPGRLIQKLTSITFFLPSSKKILNPLTSKQGIYYYNYQHHIFEGLNPEKHVSDIIFVGRWLFKENKAYINFNVKSWKIAVFRQIMNQMLKLFIYKNGNVITLKKRKRGNKKPEKRSTPLGASSKQRSQWVTVGHCYFCDVRSWRLWMWL